MSTTYFIKFRSYHTLWWLLKPPYSTSLSTCTGTKRRYSGPVLQVFYSLIYTNETSGLSLSESGGGGIERLPYARGMRITWQTWTEQYTTPASPSWCWSLSGSGLCAQMYFQLLPNPPFVYSASTSMKTFQLLPTKTMALSPLFNPVLDICLPALLL